MNNRENLTTRKIKQEPPTRIDIGTWDRITKVNFYLHLLIKEEEKIVGKSWSRSAVDQRQSSRGEGGEF